MTRAPNRGAQVRRDLRLRGQADAETAANGSSLEVWAWPFRVLQEMQAFDFMGGSQRLGQPWQRWMIAHAIGHKLLHPGRRLWMQEHTQRGGRVELWPMSSQEPCSWTDGRRWSTTAFTLGRCRVTLGVPGMGRLQGLCDRTTGSAEVCSLLTRPPLTDLSLPTVSFGISLCEAQAP